MCQAVPLMPPPCGHRCGLKGGHVAVVLSKFKRFLGHYTFLEGSAPERRQSSRGSRSQVTAGVLGTVYCNCNRFVSSRLPTRLRCSPSRRVAIGGSRTWSDTIRIRYCVSQRGDGSQILVSACLHCLPTNLPTARCGWPTLG